jgi:hypothetical protein
MPTKVSTIEIDMTELDDILRRVDANELTEGDCEAIRTLCKAYVQLTELLKDKNTSLTRLRKLLFGSTTEKTKTVLGNDQDSPSPSARAVTASTSDVEIVEKTPAKGHGRNGADAYAGAQKVVVRHNTLQPGDPCPKCEAGTVYETGRPGLRDRPARFTRQAGPAYWCVWWASRRFRPRFTNFRSCDATCAARFSRPKRRRKSARRSTTRRQAAWLPC